MKNSEKKYEVDYKDVENGPVDKRDCRDIICCILFLCASIALFGIFVNGVSNAKYKRLYSLYDSNTPVNIFILEKTMWV